MLILSRRPGEEIRIGEHVKVVVLGVVGLQVKLGIAAPPDVLILREELLPRSQNAGEGEVS
jgi:carbon storage regulator